MDYKFKNGMYIVGDETYSPEEFNNISANCHHCGNRHLKENMTYTSDTNRWFCEDCDHRYNICEQCGDAIEYPSYYDDSDYAYCSHCFRSDNYWVCDECGSIFRYRESGNYDNNDIWYCNCCIDNGHGYFGSRGIGSYHDFKESGRIEFCGKEDRTESPYMGYELEIDGDFDCNRTELAERINDEFDTFFHCEYDGSLDYGFEIISQPASIGYHLDSMPRYKDMFADIIKSGFTSHNARTCGLHIHLDRRYFEDKEDSAIAKLLYIFEKHWTNLVRFSRRRESQMEWCSRYGDKPTNIVKTSKTSRNYYGRYYAVNLCNSHTVEIRLWRGSLNPTTFEATLKFTARLAEICKTKSAIEISRMSFEALLGDDETIKAYWETVKNREV